MAAASSWIRQLEFFRTEKNLTRQMHLPQKKKTNREGIVGGRLLLVRTLSIDALSWCPTAHQRRRFWCDSVDASASVYWSSPTACYPPPSSCHLPRGPTYLTYSCLPDDRSALLPASSILCCIVLLSYCFHVILPSCGFISLCAHKFACNFFDCSASSSPLGSRAVLATSSTSECPPLNPDESDVPLTKLIPHDILLLPPHILLLSANTPHPVHCQSQLHLPRTPIHCRSAPTCLH